MSKQLSLENFNPHERKPPYLMSPRSIEACKRQGIDPSEILIKTEDDIKLMYGNVNKEALELHLHRHETRRQEKLKILIEERKYMIDSG